MAIPAVDREIVPHARLVERLNDRTVYTRSYRVPRAETSTTPTIGEAVTLDGVSGSGIMQPRVMAVQERLVAGQAEKVLTIRFYVVRPYSGTPTAAGTELLGSRMAAAEGTSRAVQRYFATSDAATGLPAAGDLFPGDTGDLARRCAATPSDRFDVPFPGLWFHVARYEAPVGYST